MRYQIHQLDTCTSDYFSGYHNPTIQISVDGKSTYQDIFDALNDLYWSTDHIEDLDENAYRLAVAELQEHCELSLAYKQKSLESVFNPGIEICPEGEEDNWETCYIFFGLDTVEEDEDEDE